jgi:hypothetical protein
MYPSFDPGPVTGVAKFNNRGVCLEIAQIPLDELTEYLEEIPTQTITVAIMEEYTQLPHKLKALASRKTNKLEVAQAEGMIKSWCKRKGIHLVMQPASILPIAQRWTQLRLPRDHSISHGPAARLHGEYYLIDKGIKKSILEQQIEEGN